MAIWLLKTSQAALGWRALCNTLKLDPTVARRVWRHGIERQVNGEAGAVLKKLLSLQRQGLLPLGVGVHQLTISHDGWCGIYRKKRCNCNPAIQLPWSAPAVGKN